MRVAILGGGGAMGGIFGGWLQAAGNDVTLVDVSRDAVAAINAKGLRIDEKDGSTQQIAVPASANPAEIGPVDLIVNFVKCYHTEAAINGAKPMIGPRTTVLTLQNGWGNANRIAAIVGREKVLVGITYHSGTLMGPGHVRHPNTGPTHIGELSGETTERVKTVVAAFQGAGFDTTLSTAILTDIWKKLAHNCCALPTSSLMRCFAHELVAHEGMMSEMRAILEEIVAVAQAQRIPLDLEERWTTITGTLAKGVGARASMLQDVEAKRRTEIDVINGAIVDAGRRTGVATPHNDAMVWLIRSLEGAYLAEAAKGRAA